MKKYIRLSLVTALLIALFLFLPTFAGGMVTTVTVIRPGEAIISEDIYVSGAVEESVKKDIYVELPIVPQKVNVQIGDHVEPHDVIAEVDTQATQAALFDLVDASNMIPQEYLAVMGNIRVSEQLVKDYIPTEITAPSGGTITAINLVQGAMATPKSAVCTISNTEEIRVKMTVGELDADRVQVGDKVVFRASATGGQKYTGIVERIFPTATKTLVGTVQQTVVGLYVKMSGNFDRLKPGYTVTGVVKKQGDIAVLTVPYEAVQQDDTNTEYVYVYQKGRAVRKDIVTGEEMANGVEVKSGVTANDILIKNAGDVKQDNSPVKNIE